MSDTAASDTKTGRSFGRGRGAEATPTANASRKITLSRTTILRIVVLTLAAGSGWTALQLASIEQPAPQQVAAPPPPPPIETEDVLVTANALTLGRLVNADDLTWVAWPKKLVMESAIRRSASPQAKEEMIGTLARAPFIKGEPVRAEKLVRANGAGMLAAMLPSGYRAIAIPIDAQGASTAGGFILPNDRVDVIRTLTRVDPNKPGEGTVASETLLTNVRVLAIGQNIQERNGERVVTGSNATLEVDPTQAELLAQAQRSGQLSLALRSLADTGDAPATVASSVGAPQNVASEHVATVSVMRGAKRQDYAVREQKADAAR